MIQNFFKKQLGRLQTFFEERGWKKTAKFVSFTIRYIFFITLLLVTFGAFSGFLSVWDHFHPDSRINFLASISESIFGEVYTINSKLDNLRSENTVDCYEISEHLWDMKDVLVFNNSDIKILGEDGLIRFKRPVKDLFVFDFIFKQNNDVPLNTIVAFKDVEGSEVSLAIGSQDNQTLYWNYKDKGTPIYEERKNLQGSVKPNTDVKLRIETIEKPDHLVASAFLIYTPKGKDFQAPPIYLKDFGINRFQDKETFLHVGFNEKISQQTPPTLKITECKIQEKDGIQR